MDFERIWLLGVERHQEPLARTDHDACPMHEPPGNSSIRKLMMPAEISHRRNTRHR